MSAVGNGALLYGSAGVAPAPAVVAVEESSQVGEARRAAVAVAVAAGFDETAQGRVALVATEAATNLVKHATGGTLVVQAPNADGERAFVEIVAVDRGPGMADPDACMRDGFSTAGTSGSGLGAIRRAADFFEIDSRPGRGTALVARLWPKRRDAAPDETGPGRLRVGAVCVPLAGETVCGDAWALAWHGDDATLLLADGLGHGAAAAVAAERATHVLAAEARRGAVPAPCALLDLAHGALRPTRGAAVTVVALDARTDRLRAAGVGNVAGGIARASDPAAARSLVAQNGIVGHQMRSCHELAYDWPADALLVLATDGVKPHWRLETYPGLARRHPSLVAATIWRDHARGRDDATVVVVARADANAPRCTP